MMKFTSILPKIDEPGARRLELKESERGVTDPKYLSHSYKSIFAVEDDTVIGQVKLYKRWITFSYASLLIGGLGGIAVQDHRLEQDISTELMRRGIKQLRKDECTLIFMSPASDSLANLGFRRLKMGVTFKDRTGHREFNNSVMVSNGILLKDTVRKIALVDEYIDIGVGYW